MNYRVTWTIELEADNAAHAADLAHEIQQDPESTALIFDVVNENGIFEQIDLLGDSDDSVN